MIYIIYITVIYIGHRVVYGRGDMGISAIYGMGTYIYIYISLIYISLNVCISSIFEQF